MVAFISRNRGVLLTRSRFGFLYPAPSDFDSPVTTAVARLIEASDPIRAGELSQASGGLALAHRLVSETKSTNVYMLAVAHIRDEIAPIVVGSPKSWWAPIDAGALLARVILRIMARPTVIPQSDSVLFVTNDRHHGMIMRYLSSNEQPLVINVRKESQTVISRSGTLRALGESWRSGRGMRLGQRIRHTRLTYEAANLAPLLAMLIEQGLTKAYFADITGHRVRILATLSVSARLSTIVMQHGRAGNLCRYIPPAGVRFVSAWESDLMRIKSALTQPERIEWQVSRRGDRRSIRSGSSILVCPAFLGSTDRFRRLQTVVKQWRNSGADIGIRFHPSERFPALKARLLGVTRVDSSTALEALEERWGAAVVPFPSTVKDDLEAAGFRIVEG